MLMVYLRIPDIAVDLELWAEPRNTAGIPFTLHGTPVDNDCSRHIAHLYIHVMVF